MDGNHGGGRSKVKAKLARLRDALGEGLVERDEPVRLMLAAMLAGEHLLLLGPPGTAKSELARRLAGATGGTFFERLLTRFSVPEELFGPLSLAELERDRYVRRVEGYLPSATVAFVDEVFKANSAILNSLLTILNERLYDNGTSRERIPLVCLVGASNELPTGDELAALYDRFLIRYQVGSVGRDRFAEMALGPETTWAPPPRDLQITDQERDEIRVHARALPLSSDVVDLLRGLRDASAELGLTVSDRRWKKIVKLLRTVALADDRGEVTAWDFWVVPHCLWSSPEQRPAVQEWYEKHLGVDASTAPERTRRIIVTMREELKRMQAATDPVFNPKTGKPRYRAADGSERDGAEPKQLYRGKAPLFVAPDGRGDRTNGGKGFTADELQQYRYLPAEYFDDRANWLLEAPSTAVLEPRKYARAEIDDCLRHVAEPRQAVETALGDLDEKIAAAAALLATHLIVPPSFREPALAGLRANQQTLQVVCAELRQLEEGFAALPRKPEREPT